MAIRDRAPGVRHQTACRSCARHRACRKALRDGAHVGFHQASGSASRHRDAHAAAAIADDTFVVIGIDQATGSRPVTGQIVDTATGAAASDRSIIATDQAAERIASTQRHVTVCAHILDQARIGPRQHAHIRPAKSVAIGAHDCIDQINIAHHAAARDRVEHANRHAILGLTKRQTDDVVAQSIKFPHEGHAQDRALHAAQGRKTRAPIPVSGGAGVDMAAQDVVALHIPINPLQIDTAEAASHTDTVDDRVVNEVAIISLPGAEIIACWQIHRCIDIVAAAIALRASPLAIFESQAGRAGTAQRRIDMDVIVRGQGQLVGRP